MNSNIPSVSNGDPTSKRPYPEGHRLPILGPAACIRIRLWYSHHSHLHQCSMSAGLSAVVSLPPYQGSGSGVRCAVFGILQALEEVLHLETSKCGTCAAVLHLRHRKLTSCSEKDDEPNRLTRPAAGDGDAVRVTSGLRVTALQ